MKLYFELHCFEVIKVTLVCVNGTIDILYSRITVKFEESSTVQIKFILLNCY